MLPMLAPMTVFIILRVPSNCLRSLFTSGSDVPEPSAILPRNEELEPKIIVATEISQNCIDLVKQAEGFRDTAYRLSGESNYTIGYGHTNASVYEGQTITEEAAERLLIADLKGYEEYVLKY